ncbi:unnamed protein product [Phyllotreta striolata]|uniref:Uncharacterized protein n=1 Tax=Phyllotreta striolata TaxID=444603 RepID=A0A9N9XM89_PHYSR|nr:unnamed protein product [Phyllotreta striolata]
MKGGPRENRPPFFKSVRNYFREYCQCSSIHGFRYFGEKRTHFERVWWFVVFSVTLAGCVMSIRMVYKRWVRSPVIVSFATKETPIYSIPWPAVTICPEFKSNQNVYSHSNVVQKFASNQSLTQKEEKILQYMGLICDDNEIIKYTDEELTFTDDFYKTLEEISEGVFPFQSCEYFGFKLEGKDCLTWFRPIITDEGICYTFNVLDKHEIFKDPSWLPDNYYKADKSALGLWTMDGGYSRSSDLHAYPRRALLAGATNALSVTLNMSYFNKDYSCKKARTGFRVTLHLPSRVPRPSQDYFQVPLNEIVLAAVRPELTTTDPDIEIYNPSRRECYFPDEKELKFFKLYTARNCALECLTNYTLNICGCVNFYMPRDNATEMCGIGKANCMKDAQFNFELAALRMKIHQNNQSNISPSEMKNFLYDYQQGCNCMPTCTDLTYNVETSQSKLDYVRAMKVEQADKSFNADLDTYYVSKLILFFKSSQFIGSERHVLYGPTDFLANFGGLLGLFTGFSILSLMEAIYFLTVRLCCNSRLYGYWAGPDK